MSDPDFLLGAHRPVVRYDRHEVYFADSAAEWTDSPGQTLRRYPEATVLAQAPSAPPIPLLTLDFLGPSTYGDGGTVEREDLIACPTKNYLELARRLHAKPEYANRVYGHAANGSDGRTWLQYWFFYFYNDLELLGDAFPAGLHEGDWEMIQLRLDESAAEPDLAVYAKHKAGEARRWSDVEKLDGTRPVVYVARGSHASYFTSGTHWGEAWFDHADGQGASPELTLEIVHDDDPDYNWVRWPGLWGDTKPNSSHIYKVLDDSSPRGPGGHTYYHDPHKLLETVANYQQYEHQTDVSAPPPAAPAAIEPAAPSIALSRNTDQDLQVRYESPDWPVGLQPVRLLVTANSHSDPDPPTAEGIAISGPAGMIQTHIKLNPAWGYEVHASIAGQPSDNATAPPLTSASTTERLQPQD